MNIQLPILSLVIDSPVMNWLHLRRDFDFRATSIRSTEVAVVTVALEKCVHARE